MRILYIDLPSKYVVSNTDMNYINVMYPYIAFDAFLNNAIKVFSQRFKHFAMINLVKSFIHVAPVFLS